MGCLTKLLEAKGKPSKMFQSEGKSGMVMIMIDKDSVQTNDVTRAVKILVHYEDENGVSFFWHTPDEGEVSGLN